MAQYAQYTTLQVLGLLQYKFDDVPFWSDAEALDAINEALLTWNSFTGFWKDTITIITTANNWDYGLPASIVFGMRVEFDNHTLAIASLGDMDYGHPGWSAQTTADGGNVPTAPKKWLPLSVDMIAIWPADAVGGHTLTVDGVSATPQLINDGDFIDIGAEELGVILGYALHVLALKEGGARFGGTMGYFTDFLVAAAEENDQLTESSQFREFIGLDLNRETRKTLGGKTEYDIFGGRMPSTQENLLKQLLGGK